MAYGNDIIVSGEPKGVRTEGIIGANAGTPKPGTIMEIDYDVDADGTKRFSWEPYGVTASGGANQGVSADGVRMPIAVLLPDPTKSATTAYAVGDRCFLYFPIMGEELNILVQDVAGTGDDIVIGDKFLVDDGTGKLILSTGTPESEPFMALEDVTNPTADTLLHVMYTGY